MSAAYQQLLDATLRHLEQLKSRGVRFVPVTQERLAALALTEAPRGRRTDPATRSAALPAARAVPESSSPVRAAPPSRAAAPVVAAAKATATNVTAVAPAPEKAEAMRELRERALVCVKCPHLAGSRKNVVFGVGDIDAALMFVGEAPGADEDAQGEPFVGAAGQLLTKIIQTMGLTRQTVYIANILKCRPDTPGQSAGNRKPTPEEMKTCIPYLHSQIDLIQPRVLVALGGTALEGLLGKTEGITRVRGTWREYRGIPLMPTFHPSYLLRNQALGEKRKVWEDMLQVMERLEMPVTEKQQGYFLRG